MKTHLPALLLSFLPLALQAAEDNAGQEGWRLATTLSRYTYREAEPGIKLSGPKLGLEAERTMTLEQGRFLRGELRFLGGPVDYDSKSAGSLKGEPDWLLEGRVLAGFNYPTASGVLSPYTGLGFRQIHNDGRGTTTTGAGGYRRGSQYLYLPLGVRYRTQFAALPHTFAAEAGWLLRGRQTSRFGDVSPAYGQDFGDVINRQNAGYNLRLSALADVRGWQVGPYADYWSVGRSDLQFRQRSATGSGVASIHEPANTTLELGLRAAHRF